MEEIIVRSASDQNIASSFLLRAVSGLMILIGILFLSVMSGFAYNAFNNYYNLNGAEMLSFIEQQLSFGPRYLSSPGHQSMKKFLIEKMNSFAQDTKVQAWQHLSPDRKKYELSNIVGKFYLSAEKRIIIATHYDSKKFADKDPEKPDQPVPGANDSGSGVAVLLEIAQALANSHVTPNVGIDIIFFDGEEGEENQKGDYSTWKPIGSTYFSEHLNDLYGNKKPISGIVLDMVGDKDLRISKEQSSVLDAHTQTEAFWKIAKEIDSKVFSDKIEFNIRDDHTSLNKVGIPSFLLIDYDYQPFHTTKDTLDKCSPQSLETIATAVLNYVYSIK